MEWQLLPHFHLCGQALAFLRSELFENIFTRVIFISGGISRSFDGRISSAQQLHTVMYIMNKRQLFAAGSERAKLYHMAWNEDVAEKLLILFHNKFQKVLLLLSNLLSNLIIEILFDFGVLFC